MKGVQVLCGGQTRSKSPIGSSDLAQPIALPLPRLIAPVLHCLAPAGDSQVMGRLMDLLVGPLAAWGQRGAGDLAYAEWWAGWVCMRHKHAYQPMCVPSPQTVQ